MLTVVTSSLVLMMSLTQVLGQGSFSSSINSLVGSVQTAVGYIEDYIGGPKGCRFECPNGAKPQANPRHAPTSNGCGSFGFKMEDYVSLKPVSKCCDDHDHCYDECNADKEACDRTFKRCLERLCGKLHKKIGYDELYDGCMTTADMIYASTVALGCKPYKEAQAKACRCPGSKYQLNEEL